MMDHFHELLLKRKNLTATIYEEEELILIASGMTGEQLKDVDKSLLTYSNSERLDEIEFKLDELLSKL